jgi:ribosomal protein S9
MWVFFSRRLRMWLLLAIALPVTRALVHRLALAAERRDPSTRTAKTLLRTDSMITGVSRRAERKKEHRKAER